MYIYIYKDRLILGMKFINPTENFFCRNSYSLTEIKMEFSVGTLDVESHIQNCQSL